MSPSNATNDGNPPGSDNEPMPELATEASLAEGFSLVVDSRDVPLGKDDQKASVFCLKRELSESDGDESDGYKSATEEMDSMDANQKGTPKQPLGKNMGISLRSFPIGNSPDSFLNG